MALPSLTPGDQRDWSRPMFTPQSRMYRRSSPPSASASVAAPTRAVRIDATARRVIRRIGALLGAGPRQLGRIAGDGGPLHEPLVAGGVVGGGAVEDAAVVPHDQVAFPPLVPVAELGLGDVIEQGLEERAALLERQAVDVRGVSTEEEGPPLVHRVGPHE